MDVRGRDHDSDKEDADKEKDETRPASIVVVAQVQDGEDNKGAKRDTRTVRSSEGGLRARDPNQKRLFGVLLGQLNKAKKQITQETRSGAIKTQGEAKQRAEQRLQEQKEREKRRIARKFKQDKKDELVRQRDLAQKLHVLQLDVLQAVVDEQERLAGNFILSSTQPAVRYLPKKHNTKTEALVQASRETSLRRITEGPR